MSQIHEDAESDIHLVSSYSIAGQLSGVGRPILIHVLHEMDGVVIYVDEEWKKKENEEEQLL